MSFTIKKGSSIKDANSTIKLSKRKFGKTRIEYLGYIVEAGIEPGNKKLDAIRYFPENYRILLYYFPGIKNYVKRHIKMCIECTLTKTKTGKQPGLLHPIPPGRRPFAVIHIDHLGPFVTSNKGNKYILVMIDNLTKFVQLEAVKSTKAETTVTKLETFLQRYGAPETIITDRGTSFTSTKFEHVCNVHGIKHPN
ncbi:Integrase core domain [Popillia japonica]|uniref:Integrase core domain n=1 Tax=Popillia japonica TaxID=7064 RepID=A0AAW1LR39_POPJA